MTTAEIKIYAEVDSSTLGPIIHYKILRKLALSQVEVQVVERRKSQRIEIRTDRKATQNPQLVVYPTYKK